MDQIFGNSEPNNAEGQNFPIDMAQPNFINSMNEPHIEEAPSQNALDFNFIQQSAPVDSQYNIPEQQQQQQHQQQQQQQFQPQQNEQFDAYQPPSEPLRSESDQQQEFNAFSSDAGNEGGTFFGVGGVSDPYQNVFSAQPQMDEEERMLLQAVEQKQQERLMILAEKDRQQMKVKQEKRLHAQQSLNQWRIQRGKDIEKRMEMNYNAEQNFRELQESYKSKPNPWEKVVDNVEIKASNYAGTKDVNRLRSSILNKKADFGKLQ